MSRYTELIKEHGSLEEFITACENAFDDGLINWEEKERAIEEYRRDLVSSIIKNG